MDMASLASISAEVHEKGEGGTDKSGRRPNGALQVRIHRKTSTVTMLTQYNPEAIWSMGQMGCLSTAHAEPFVAQHPTRSSIDRLTAVRLFQKLTGDSIDDFPTVRSLAERSRRDSSH